MATQTKPVYVFDLDGVITNPENSQVDEAVVAAIHRLLETGYRVAINTGRSFEWVERNLTDRLKASSSAEIFNGLIAVVCEKGGEIVTWNGGGWMAQTTEFALPHEAYAAAKATFRQHQSQLGTMFWDATKRTMATIEKQPSAGLAAFQAEQTQLVALLTESLRGQAAKVDGTTIAIDIESPTAGKHAGAQLIYQWGNTAEYAEDCTFISIGDSASDYEMARYFAEQQVPSTFVYVGMPTNKIATDERVTFVATQAHYAAGTLEFLTR